MSVKYRDYYKVLGVGKDATEAELKSAFRKMARQWHPDVNKASNASDKFKEINEAYEVLKDPEKRKLYDSFGHNWQDGQNFRTPPGFEGMNANFGGRGGGASSVSDFFETLFGGSSSGGGGNPFGGGGGSPFGGGGSNPFGGGGSPFGGGDPFGGGGGNPFGGGGNPFGGGQRPRPKKKKIPSTEADVSLSVETILKGGKTSVTIADGPARGTYTISIPQGTTEGTKIRLSGQGQNGGNLILIIHVEKHGRFTVERKFNLVVDGEISPAEAALGCKITVETLEGIVRLTVPPCSSSGSRLRLKEKGLVKKNGSRGHLLVSLKIVMPESLTDDELELYKKLADLGNSDKNVT